MSARAHSPWLKSANASAACVARRLLLGIIAAVFYVGFIAMMIWRATR